MKKDIEILEVEGVFVAVVKGTNEAEEVEWNVVLINGNEEKIHSVFVTSKGYTPKDENGESKQTSTLRHFFPNVDSQRYVRVEPIMPELFHLFNEYWVSYYIGDKIYDKKFIFVPDSITEENLIDIPDLGLLGVVHK